MTQEARWGGRVHELSIEECHEQLVSCSVGRLAFIDDDGPLILPVNFTVVEGAVVFRTSAHNTIASHVNGKVVAFEVDDVDDFLQVGWSVLVRGRAHFAESVHDIPADRRPTPWAEGIRSLLVQISIDSVSGRRVLPS